MRLTLHIDIWKWEIIPTYDKSKYGKTKKVLRTFGWACIKFVLRT